MAHSTTHCDVIDCPTCHEGDVLGERDSQFDTLLSRLYDCSLISGVDYIDSSESSVTIGLSHVIEADGDARDWTGTKAAFLRHLEELADYIRENY